MTYKEKAKIILEHIDQYIVVNSAFEDIWLKAIINGLKEIERREKDGV